MRHALCKDTCPSQSLSIDRPRSVAARRDGPTLLQCYQRRHQPPRRQGINNERNETVLSTFTSTTMIESLRSSSDSAHCRLSAHLETRASAASRKFSQTGSAPTQQDKSQRTLCWNFAKSASEITHAAISWCTTIQISVRLHASSQPLIIRISNL